MRKSGFFSRLIKGLDKARQGFTHRVDELIKYYREIDDDFFDELEEILITADVGVNTTIEIVDELRDLVKEKKIGDAEKIKSLLKEKIISILANEDDFELNSPAVMLVVGVNGVGKTTTIGKLSAHTIRIEGEAAVRCTGNACPAQQRRLIIHYVSRDAMDITGLGPAIVDQLLGNNLIDDVGDLYYLNC